MSEARYRVQKRRDGATCLYMADWNVVVAEFSPGSEAEGERIVTALADLVALRAEIERLRGILADVEWSGAILGAGSEYEGACCPECGAEAPRRKTYSISAAQPGHKPDCKLSAALAAGES